MEYKLDDNSDKSNKNKFKYKVLIILSIIFLVYGITLVNVNLAEVIREKSSFLVSFNNNPPEVVVDLGENHVIFSTKVFKEFKDGIAVIYDAIKDTVVSLKR
ncbi:hypothetical protein [Clostridium tunisiense]|uniref:hypothetical protein n=1 Tax=Clostridium tunisiense TaxID=219748 RepID=UPI0002DCDB4A|nr:hypothetical protein [Clostridium tunisiense]